MEVQEIYFKFKPRNRMLDWKKIGSINIDQLMTKPDLTVLEDNLENVTFCNLHKEFNLHHTDPNFIKLFLLSQLIIEYFLYSHDYLLEKIKTNIEVIEALEKTQSEHALVVNDLKDELKRVVVESHNRKKIIITQQKMMTFGPQSYFKCLFCDMAFLNKSLYKKHLLKTHPDQVDDSKNSELLEHFKIEIKELNIKVEKEVENGERLKKELEHKDSEMREKFEKMKLNYEDEMNKIQQNATRLINEANMKQKQSEKTISILLNKQKSQENNQLEINQRSEHVLQQEIKSLKARNVKLESELSIMKRLHEREIERLKKDQVQKVVTNEKSTSKKKSKNKENDGRKVMEEDFEEIVETNAIHMMKKFKIPPHIKSVGHAKKHVNTKNNDDTKQNNIWNKKHMDTQNNINATKQSKKQDDIQINVQKCTSDVDIKEKVITINNIGKGINTNVTTDVRHMKLRFEVPGITDKQGGQGNQYIDMQLTAIKQDIENEIHFIIRNTGVEVQDPHRMSQESYTNVSQILLFERQKLAKNYHGFKDIREEIECRLEEFMQQITKGQAIPIDLEDQLMIDQFPVDQLLARMDGNYAGLHPTEYSPIHWPIKSNVEDDILVHGMTPPSKHKTQTSPTSMLPKSTDSEISELEDISSMTEMIQDNSSKQPSFVSSRKSASLGSEILSNVSSILTEESGEAGK